MISLEILAFKIRKFFKRPIVCIGLDDITDLELGVFDISVPHDFYFYDCNKNREICFKNTMSNELPSKYYTAYLESQCIWSKAEISGIPYLGYCKEKRGVAVSDFWKSFGAISVYKWGGSPYDFTVIFHNGKGNISHTNIFRFLADNCISLDKVVVDGEIRIPDGGGAGGRVFCFKILKNGLDSILARYSLVRRC